jgi:glycosyltransferase involved in cell wall biosynthesis
LVVGGEGPEFEKVKRIAGPNVKLVGHQPFKELVHYMQRARAFVFAAEEDFGIVPVEAMACGTPVVSFGRGGAAETVVDGRTGVTFDRQTPESLLEAIARFETLEAEQGWDAHAISAHAARFGTRRFRDELHEVVLAHHRRRAAARARAGIDEPPVASPQVSTPQDVPTPA